MKQNQKAIELLEEAIEKTTAEKEEAQRKREKYAAERNRELAYEYMGKCNALLDSIIRLRAIFWSLKISGGDE